jgi:hypothetical protein
MKKQVTNQGSKRKASAQPKSQPAPKRQRFQGPRSGGDQPVRMIRDASERQVNAPAALGSVQGASRPNFSSSTSNGDLRVRVRHREYVTDITGSVAFAVAQYNINPGLASLFPWLSGLAALFESYKFNRLSFQYRTESSTSQVGKALLAVDWDVLDAAPLSKQAMMQERTKADGPTWVNFDLKCDLADLLKFGVQRYIRSGSQPAGSDLKTYDVGMLNVGSQGCTNAPVIGELWIEYDVELITPNTSAGPPSGKIISGSAVSNAAIFGTAPTVTGNSSVAASGSTLTFAQPGMWLVDVIAQGTLSAITVTTGTVTVITSAIAGNVSEAIISSVIEVTAVGQTLIYSSPTGTVTSSITRIAAYNSALLG